MTLTAAQWLIVLAYLDTHPRRGQIPAEVLEAVRRAHLAAEAATDRGES